MSFPGGIHVPSLTFFKSDSRQEIDWDVQEIHFAFLVSSGVHGSQYSVIFFRITSSYQTDSSISQS